MTAAAQSFPPRTYLLDKLHTAQADAGFLRPEAVAAIALELQIPAAEAWAAATSYPELRFEPAGDEERPCLGLSCKLRGAGRESDGTACTFQCYAAPVIGHEQPFPETALRVAGPVKTTLRRPCSSVRSSATSRWPISTTAWA